MSDEIPASSLDGCIRWVKEVIEPTTITDTSHPVIAANLRGILSHLRRLKRIEDRAKAEMETHRRRMREIFPPTYFSNDDEQPR